MELLEEAKGSKDQTQIKKGKRTKRQRPTSPLTLTMASPSSTTAEGGNSGGGECFSDNSGEEEEDMANCLILLAQGSSSTHQTRNFSTQIPPATTAKSAGGLYIYECKTCNRCFPSFQALGGHRASHKKPKSTIEEKIKSTLIKQVKEDHKSDSDSTLTLSLQFPNRALSISTNNNKSRVHECSICGAEFTSGQALGGHMRRHRSAISTTINPDHESQLEGNKPRNGLSLDLNLPAPEDDHRESTLIPFASKGQVIVFSASPLVDCHY